MSDPNPLSVEANALRKIVEDDLAHGYEFERVYGDATLYGDVQYIYSKLFTTVNIREGEDHSVNEHQVGVDRRRLRPDLVEGELEFALNRCETALAKLDGIEDDPYRLAFKLQRAKETMQAHYKAAKNGRVYHV